MTTTLALGLSVHAGLESQGASNTAGWGAQLPLNLRITNFIANSNNKECSSTLQSRRIFYSIDYFFPTNFPDLSKLNADQLKVKVTEKIEQWTKTNELVYLSLLPQFELLSAENLKTIQSANGSIKFIFDTLSKDEYKNGSKIVNETILELSKKNQKVLILDFNSLISAFSREKNITEKAIFKDPLHFNDAGQAFLFNYWLAPQFRKISGCEKIENMPYTELEKLQVATALEKSVLKKDSWLQKQPGNYWAKIANLNSRLSKSVKFHIPGTIVNSKENIVTSAENFDKIDQIRSQIADEKMKKRFTELYGVTQLIEQSDQPGFPVQLHPDDHSEWVTFDLSRIFYYTQISFSRASQNEKGVIQAFGYDHWLSYKFYHRVLKWGVFFSPVPATNYQFFVKKSESSPMGIKVKLLIYPMLEANGKVQEVELVRLSQLPAIWMDEIKNNGQNYPYLEYDIELEISNP